MKKTYYYSAREARLVFSKKGITRRIDFTGGITAENGYKDTLASFTTEDATIQSMIESDPRFGKSIKVKEDRKRISKTLEEAEESTISTQQEEAESAIVPEVTTINEAIEYLNTQCNVAKRSMTSRNKVLAVAQEKNISFPNLK